MDQVYSHNVDLQIKKNNTDHHTHEITTKRLIVRRGQGFQIRLALRNGDFKENNISFIVEPGTPNLRQNENKKHFGLSSGDITNGWSASVVSKDKSYMNIKILPPANAVIGRHTLTMQISDQNGIKHNTLGEFIILFNAWCKGDATFLKNEQERNEYVMNENGFIFVGNSKHISKRSWIFGQFDEDIVDICLAILDNSLECEKNALEDYNRRNDPVYISRVLSAMINNNDDKGVIAGRWKEPYEDGTSPMKWNGSTLILRQWFSRRFKAVKYGQCWVFASVLCTVLRCLGIPTRVVTNFDSAHDTDGNLYIDQYFNTEDKMFSSDTRDSIWNFHVWNESWMERGDLPPGYGGWQVLDATPQERSNSIFCCGPASVKAIKEGDINLSYDCPFVFAEVNADIIKWFVNSDKTKKEKFFYDSKKVGRQISTKNVGNNDRMDITQNYKYGEGSDKERQAFTKALHLQKNPYTTYTATPNPCLGEIGLDLRIKLKEAPVFGQDIQLIILITNLTTQIKNINLNLIAHAMENNGANMKLMWDKSDSIKIKSREEYSAIQVIPYSVYKISLSESNLVKVSVFGRLSHSMENILVERKITLDSPRLEVEVNENEDLNAPTTVTVKFSNPLSEELCSSTLTLEGNGLIKRSLEKKLGTLEPGATLTSSFTLIPYKCGKNTLQVLFTSDKIKFIREYIDINVSSLPGSNMQ